MFSDDSSGEENVCVIARSILERPTKSFISHLCEFLKEAGYSRLALRDFTWSQPQHRETAACVWCPPLCLANEQV